MRKAIAAGAAVLSMFAAVTFAEEKGASIPREGTSSATQVLSGPLHVVALGKDHARLSYDVMGVRMGDTPSDLFHDASVRCLGALTVVNGSFDDDAGNCILTRPDGDQAFSLYKGSGKAGARSQGTWTFIGGTGKLAGITGKGEWTRYNVRPAMEGTSQSVAKVTGTYKLPPASASR